MHSVFGFFCLILKLSWEVVKIRWLMAVASGALLRNHNVVEVCNLTHAARLSQLGALQDAALPRCCAEDISASLFSSADSLCGGVREIDAKTRDER